METEDLFAKIVLRLLYENDQIGGVFYAGLISQTTRIKTEEIPTAGVTVQNGRMLLYWNEKFFKKLNNEEQVAVLEHEMMHLINDHITRRVDRDHQLFNIAADLAINQFIKNIPTRCLLDDCKVKDCTKHGCVTLDKFPKEYKLMPNRTAEEYYDILYKNSPKMQITQNADGSYHVKIKDGNGKVQGEFDTSNSGNHEKWEESDSPEIVKEIVRQSVKQAKEQSEKARGHLPGHLDEMIKDLLKPAIIPWQHILRQFVAMSIKSGHKASWKRPNRRYGEQQKGKLPARMVAITVYIDTSGSISEEDFNDFIAEMKSIQQCYKSNITVLEGDTEVTKQYTLTPYSAVDTNFSGRGGTSFRPAFEYIKDKQIKTDVLVFFTDLYGDFPSTPPNYPVLFVSTSDSSVKAPFGHTLVIRDHKQKD